jgi:RNA polymerase sigma-70 factor (ECF subfamily)
MTAPDLPPGLARPETRAPPPPDPRWREWYQAHARAVYGYIRLHVVSPDEAEDLTADTFLKAFRAAPRFDARTASVRTWMLAIARNTIRDHRRRTRRRRQLALATLRDLAADHPSPEERLLWEDEVRRLLEALAQLPERDRELLGLRYGAELAPAEIAQALGIREAAVRTRLWRALKRLRRCWPA